MGFANLMQESARLSTATEYSDHFTDADYDWGQSKTGQTCEDPCTESASCKDKCKVHYYGRGYLQTTWMDNYKNASELGNCNIDGDGDSVDILKDPSKIESDKRLAWCTASYYWKTAVH